MLRRHARRFLRFVAGGGVSLRTGRYFAEAAIVGVLAGFVVVAFHYMIRFGWDWIFVGLGRNSAWRLAVLPPLGAVLGHFLIRRFDSLEHARGTDSAILAYHRRHGYVPPAVIPVKSTASVLTVASGGSAGYEGPVTLVGAACGSLVASWFGLSRRARRILMTAGMSAGIAALFQAPLAGAIFGFEILYSSSDVESDPILPCFIAASISYTIHACFFGWDPLFHMPDGIRYDNGLRLVPYFVLAVVVTYGARFYISVFRGTESMFSRLKWPGWTKVAVGGAVAGLAGLVMPQVLGTSYPMIAQCLDPRGYPAKLLVAFFFIKAVATSFTVGSGGSGGVFAPAIACGGALGASVGILFKHICPWMGIHPAAFALVGMAGFLASCNRIPIAAIVMVSEISGNHQLLLPAMWVCCISFWLNNGWTLYRSQFRNRAASPVHSP